MSILVLALLACGGPAAPDATTTNAALQRTDKWPEGFEWNVEKFPRLAEIALDDNGLPVDPAYMPGPDGVPASVLELAGFEVEPPNAFEDAPPLPETQAKPSPPARFRCDDDQTNRCFVHVPVLEGWVGAQSSDAAAPAYDTAAHAEEGPPYLAKNGDYWIMATEASVAHLLRCRAAGACEFPPELDDVLVETERTQPARRVTLQEAEAVCRFHKARLPTEEEWELAARGTDGARFPWGDEPGCGVDEAGAVRTTCTRDKAVYGEGPGPHRLRHMAGNLAEWTSSRAAAYTADGLGEPAEDERRFVVRGGSWSSEDPLDHRLARRTYVDLEVRRDDVGFRCVWNPGKAE